VGEDFGVVAAGFLKGVGKDAETSGLKRPGRQDTVVVGGGRKSKDGGRLPCGADGDGAEGVAKQVTDQVAIILRLLQHVLARSHGRELRPDP
jgi:hypothetical protein